MFSRMIVLTACSLSLLFLPACSGEKKEAAHRDEGHREESHKEAEKKDAEHGHDDHGEEGHSDEVTLSKEAAEAAGITVGEVKEQPLAASLELPARLAPDETKIARLNARASGRVASISANAGDRVASGKPLAVLESRELADAGLEYREARVTLEAAKSSLERVKLLVEGKAVARKQLVEEETRYANAEAKVANAVERLRLLGAAVPEAGVSLQNTIAITSPISGTVLTREASQGETVDPSKTLFTVADLSALWIIAEVPENEVARIRKGQRATVTVDAMPGKSFSVVIDHVYDLMDPETRRIKVRASLRNPGTLKPEMFATMRIAAGQTDMAPAIPASAVVREGGKTAVFVEDEPLTFAKRTIEVGPEQDGWHRVLSGLKAGERIAVKGAFTLKAEMEKSELGEGHAH
ncbi:MAG: efflux RND transporter periplasmic adaptor subunit [Nitrospirota bacterium]|nr:efflux RND transporter periplasmic adaptor subunit [Nitrospirota bacterium]